MNLLENSALWIISTSLLTCFSAQFIKLLIGSFKKRKFILNRILTTGGMPSSHSALMSALSCSVGLVNGFNSSLFAICIIFSLLVMHDAMSVRRSVGIQAQSLNNLNKAFQEIIDQLLSEKHELKLDRIKELLGHSPLEVLAGALYGVVFAFSSFYLCSVLH